MKNPGAANRGFSLGDRMKHEGNEPSPLLLFGLALIPLFGVFGWFALGWFSRSFVGIRGPAARKISGDGAAMDKDERDQDILLLKQILNSRGRARVSANVDDRPYRRMQSQGWLIHYKDTAGDAIYEITEAGLKVLASNG
jgi:hypothetical protein